MTVTRLRLDMDKKTNTWEATCDMEMSFPYSDPRYEKIFPNGTQRTIYEWEKMGRLSIAKPGHSL